MFASITQTIVFLLIFKTCESTMCSIYNAEKFNITSCDSLSYLYNNDYVFNSVNVQIIINENSTNHLEPLEPISSKIASKIVRLTITNALNNISSNAFSNFKNIEYLQLSQNNLRRIFSGTFRELLNLTYLSLFDNQIEIFEPGSFQNLPQLKELRVTGNQIGRIEGRIFDFEANLLSISLSKSSISTIERGAFKSAKKLRLNGNKLRTFSARDILLNLNLEILWLQENLLTQVTSYMLDGLKELTLLNLGFNEIEDIEPNSFNETPKLKTLVLTNNKLKIIDGDILPVDGFKRLEILYLDHNRLMFLSSKFLFRLHALKRMTLGGNPWICSCLNLVFRWRINNNVQLPCEKAFLTGEKPVCVVADSIACEYSYKYDLANHYISSLSLYSSPSQCFL